MTGRRLQFVPDSRNNGPPLGETSRKRFARGVIQPEKAALNAEQPVHDPTRSFLYYGPAGLRDWRGNMAIPSSTGWFRRSAPGSRGESPRLPACQYHAAWQARYLTYLFASTFLSASSISTLGVRAGPLTGCFGNSAVAIQHARSADGVQRFHIRRGRFGAASVRASPEGQLIGARRAARNCPSGNHSW